MTRDFAAFFDALRQSERARAAARESGDVVQFRFFSPESRVTLDLTSDPFTVSTTPAGLPDVEIAMTVEAAHLVLSGRMSIAEAVAADAARATGGIYKLLSLKSFLDAAMAEYGDGSAWERETGP